MCNLTKHKAEILRNSRLCETSYGYLPNSRNYRGTCYDKAAVNRLREAGLLKREYMNISAPWIPADNKLKSLINLTKSQLDLLSDILSEDKEVQYYEYQNGKEKITTWKDSKHRNYQMKSLRALKKYGLVRLTWASEAQDGTRIYHVEGDINYA